MQSVCVCVAVHGTGKLTHCWSAHGYTHTQVTTHTASTTYDYGSWQDASENYLPVTNYKLTKLYMKKRWTFDNAVTKAHHDARKAAWVAFHDRDVHKSVSETLKIPVCFIPPLCPPIATYCTHTLVLNCCCVVVSFAIALRAMKAHSCVQCTPV